MIEVTEVHRVRKYAAGYEVRDETWDGGHEGVPPTFMARVAYTPSGDYIGMSRFAYRLCKLRGVAPEKRSPDHCVCSIGFCEKEQKWYGWSHRAIFGFGVGHVVEEGNCTAESMPVGFEAKNLDDCRRLAVAFAESVS